MSLQKHTILIISLFVLLVSPCIKVQAYTFEPSASDSTRINYLSQNNISLSDSIINYGKLFLNTPYHYGSPGTSSFDCSGFTSYVYRNFGYNLERSSADQSRQFELVDRNQLKAGDLVFFSGRKRSGNVGHVGIVVSTKENGEFNFIHAAVHSGVTISSSAEAYYTKRFLKASRVIAANPILNVVHKFMTSRNAKAEAAAAPPKATPQVLSSGSKPDPTPVKQIKKVIAAEYHKVKPGETLSSIAQKYGVTVAELKKKNKLSGNKLKLKQRIKVKDEETVMVTVPDQTQSANKEIAGENNPESSRSKQDGLMTPNNTSHIVKKGETLFSISKLYNISIDELKKNNNIPKGKIHVGQELKLNPVQVSTKNPFIAKAEAPQKSTTHKVVSGESFYSISKMYDISVSDLMKINNMTSPKIHAGQELIVSQNDDDKATNTVAEKAEKKVENKQVDKTPTSDKTITHKVKKGESLYEIAKNNNMTIDELKKINNLSDSKIHFGQELKLSEATTETKPAETKVENTTKLIHHKIKSGESFYSIAKEYGCTVDDLKEWNKKSGSKIKAGDKIIIYAKSR